MERRSFIKGGAALALSAAATTPALGMAPQTDRRAWETAVKAKERALAQWEAYGPEYDRVHKAWLANRPSMDGIQWQPFWPAQHHPGGKDAIARNLDLEQHWRQFLASEGKTWWDHSGEDRTKKRMRAALDSVQAFRDAEAAHNRDSGMDAADAEYERLSEADSAALGKVMRLPAPDLAGLRWKLDYLTTNGQEWDSWSDSFVRQTLADIARLLPKGR